MRLAVCFCCGVVWEFVVIPAAISSLATGTPFLKCGTATLCQLPGEFTLWGGGEAMKHLWEGLYQLNVKTLQWIQESSTS